MISVSNIRFKYCNNNISINLLRLVVVFILLIYNINADVLKLSKSQVDIQNIITNNGFNENIFIDFAKQQQGLLDVVNRHFIKQKDSNGQDIDLFWQMPGFCVFQCGQDLKLLISQKRNANYDEDPVADNDPGTSKEIEKLFNYSKNMHTERQLILGVLHIIDTETIKKENNSGNVGIMEGMLIDKALCIARNKQEILRDCDKCIIKQMLSKLHKENGDNIQQDTIGNMYIYTSANPCQNVSDNGGISCVGYYNELAQLFPNIKFNVYFDADRMQLNKDFLEKDDVAVEKMCNFVIDNLLQQNPCDSGWKPGFYITNNELQYLKITNKNGVSKNTFIKLVQLGKNEITQQAIAQMKKSGGLSRLVSEVNKTLSTDILNSLQKEFLFNSIHNPRYNKEGNNIHYHLI